MASEKVWGEFDDGEKRFIRLVPALYRYYTEKYFCRDQLPGLPHLLESAQAECGFCGLPREAILSSDSRDSFKRFNGKNLEEPGPTKLAISLKYVPWRNPRQLSGRLPFDDHGHLDYLELTGKRWVALDFLELPTRS